MLENALYPIDKLTFINQEFYTLRAAPNFIDALWANGWRHFGTQFYRYNFSFYEGSIHRIFPLRINLAAFSLSKNKRRIIKKNQDLQTVIRPIEITCVKETLFERHKRRFKHGIPFSLYDFLLFDAAKVPCEELEVCVYDKDKLVAASFFDVGETAIFQYLRHV